MKLAPLIGWLGHEATRVPPRAFPAAGRLRAFDDAGLRAIGCTSIGCYSATASVGPRPSPTNFDRRERRPRYRCAHSMNIVVLTSCDCPSKGAI